MSKSNFLAVSFAVLISVLSGCASKNIPKPDAPQVKGDNRQDSTRKPKGYPGEHWDIDSVGTRDVTGGINFYGLEKEIALGKMLADDVEKHTRIIDDPIVAEYVNRVGQNLVRNSDSKVPFTIKVIDSIEVNAFALPGGFFFVNSGLIMRAENEAELAGVMAHEIAHVAARHGTRQATRGQIINLASIPLIFMGGWTGYAIRQAAGLAIPMTFLKFSRGFEKEADELGAQYLYLAGYDPIALSDFFERLLADQKRKPGTLAKVFSSHPQTKARIQFVQKLLGSEEVFPDKKGYVINTNEFMAIKTRLAQINKKWREEDKKEESGKPTLRRPGGGKIEVPEPGQEKDEDEPPVLKRRQFKQ